MATWSISPWAKQYFKSIFWLSWINYTHNLLGIYLPQFWHTFPPLFFWAIKGKLHLTWNPCFYFNIDQISYGKSVKVNCSSYLPGKGEIPWSQSELLVKSILEPIKRCNAKLDHNQSFFRYFTYVDPFIPVCCLKS